MSSPTPRGLQSILVPLDGSPLAEQAIPLAESIAERARGKLKLVLIHQPLIQMEPGADYTKLELAMQKADRAYLDEVAARIRVRLGQSVSSVVLKGAPVAQTLSVYIRELGADLVVMTSHGRSGLCRAWLGSVADQLIRSAEVPVLVVHPAEGEGVAAAAGLTEILVTLDGSPLAEAALEPAMALARLWDAEISLVQVVSPITDMNVPHLTFPSGYTDHATALRRDSAQDYIRDVAERLRAAGIRANGVAVTGGGVAETLIALAAPERISLLVVATHGLGGLKRMVLGSVADKLVRGARVPVLVVSPSGRPAALKPEETSLSDSASASP